MAQVNYFINVSQDIFQISFALRIRVVSPSLVSIFFLTYYSLKVGAFSKHGPRKSAMNVEVIVLILQFVLSSDRRKDELVLSA